MHYVKLVAEGARTVMYAEGQPEYEPLWGTQVRHPNYPVADTGVLRLYNTVLIGVRFSVEERQRLRNELLLLHLLTFGRPLTPHILTIGFEEADKLYGAKLTAG